MRSPSSGRICTNIFCFFLGGSVTEDADDDAVVDLVVDDEEDEEDDEEDDEDEDEDEDEDDDDDLLLSCTTSECLFWQSVNDLLPTADTTFDQSTASVVL